MCHKHLNQSLERFTEMSKSNRANVSDWLAGSFKTINTRTMYITYYIVYMLPVSHDHSLVCQAL